jgi:hypothetical protein
MAATENKTAGLDIPFRIDFILAPLPALPDKGRDRNRNTELNPSGIHRYWAVRAGASKRQSAELQLFLYFTVNYRALP